MRGKPHPLKQEAVRLRREERLSLREIHARTGIAKGTLSGWLRLYPLTPDERRERRRHIRRRRAAGGREAPSRHYVSVAGRALSRRDKARIAETAVAFRLALHGFGLLRALHDGDKADWVVVTPAGRYCTVQVKRVRRPARGRPYITLHCTAPGKAGKKRYRRYQPGEFDFLVGYDLYSDTAYVYSFAELGGLRAAVGVRPEAVERWDKLA